MFGRAGRPAGKWPLLQERDDCQNTISEMRGTLRRPVFDVTEHVVNLGKRTACVADVHRPCFFHMALTSSDVATSPRAISASASARSASSSGVSWIGG